MSDKYKNGKGKEKGRERKSVKKVEENRGNFMYWSRTTKRPGVVTHALSSFFGRREEEMEEGVYVYVRRIYICIYVHTCYVLISPPMPIHYVLAAVFASWFYVLIYLLHE